MKILRSRVAASMAAVAVLAMASTPALAHGRDHWESRHRYNRGGMDGGDLLAGLLVIGGIAAIASAASNSRDDRRDARYAYPGGPDESNAPAGDYADTPEPAETGRGDYPGGPEYGAGSGSGSASGFAGAVDACSNEIERSDRRVGSVDSVRRMGERYSVEGRLEDGRGFACSVDETGQIRSVAVDGHGMI